MIAGSLLPVLTDLVLAGQNPEERPLVGFPLADPRDCADPDQPSQQQPAESIAKPERPNM